MSGRHDRALRLEALEERALMVSGILQNGWLGILGTNGSDNIQVRMSGNSVRVNDNGFVNYYSGVPAMAIMCKAGDDTVVVDDNVTLSVWVDGGKGHDWIKTGSGDDAVTAGAGNDTVIGGAGIDALFGDAGDDYIQCDSGNDVASGGKGRDAIYGGDGDDILEGAAGNDAIYGELGSDVCFGRAGNDLIDGGFGNDDLLGEAGNDSIFGSWDDDHIDGGSGKDLCEGNQGDDMIKGGAGVDDLRGGDGFNLLDKDAGKDLVSDGIEVDLDQQLQATNGNVGGGTLVATYQVKNDNGVIKARFNVSVQNSVPNVTRDVLINNVAVGQITTDSNGNGELTYSTNPAGNESAFSAGFPIVRAGVKVSVGNDLQARLLPAFFVEREIVLPQMPPSQSQTSSQTSRQ